MKFDSIITLYVLTTKCWMKASVPMGTPMPTKSSGQKDARETLSVASVGLEFYHIWRHITRSLLADALGKDGCLEHVEVNFGILLEIRQVLKHLAQLDVDVSIVIILSKHLDVRVLCKRTVELDVSQHGKYAAQSFRS
jgi:hypothetical protein